MNFTINRSAFISQLNNVLRAISSKTTIPILTGLKMVVNEDNIVLTVAILTSLLKVLLMLMMLRTI